MHAVHTCTLSYIYVQNINTYIFKKHRWGYALFFYNFPFPLSMFSLHSDDSRKEKDWLLSFALLTLLPHSDFELLLLPRSSLWAVRLLQVTRLAATMPSAASEQWCLASWPFGSSAAVYLILLSIHYFQHHSTLSMTLCLPPLTIVTAALQPLSFPESLPLPINTCLQKRYGSVQVNLAGQDTISEGPGCFPLQHIACALHLFLLRLNLSSYCGRLRMLCNFIIQYLNKAQESSQPAKDQI